MSSLAVNNYVFYKIVCIDEAVDFSYIGSTCNLHKRRDKHKHSCTNPNSREYNQKKYQIIRANGGWENFKLIQIGQREQITVRESRQLEEEYRLDLKANMNDCRCYRTEEVKKEQNQQTSKNWSQNNKKKIKEQNKEYRQNNKAHITEKQKEYRQKKKEQRKEQNKEYYQNNKEQIKERKKEYDATHKEQIKEKGRVVITCQCGCEVKKWCLSRHVKTKKHLDLMKLNNE